MNDKLLSLIGSFYDCALDPTQWATVLERMGDELGGVSLVISAISSLVGLKFWAASRLDPAYDHILSKQYNTAATNQLVAAMPRLRPGVPVPRALIQDDGLYYDSPLWNDVFRRQGLAHTAIACVLRTEEYIVPMGILSPTTQKEFSEQDHRLLLVLVSHIQRAMRISLRIAALEEHASLSSESLDQLPVGLVLADGSSRVVQMNRFAQGIFAARDGFGVRNGVLTAERHDDSMAIQTAVAKVVHHGDGGKALLVARDHGHRPYVVLISPVSPAASAVFGQSRRLALLLISDPEQRPKSLDRHLIDTFCLSRKEAELAAAIFEGKQFSDIAEERGISLNTIKTQMKAIFSKTETTRQSELVRLLGSIPGI
jgi:DNA-binding CsgD family transcriptional regulator/PAS domain-containing protein